MSASACSKNASAALNVANSLHARRRREMMQRRLFQGRGKLRDGGKRTRIYCR